MKSRRCSRLNRHLSTSRLAYFTVVSFPASYVNHLEVKDESQDRNGGVYIPSVRGHCKTGYGAGCNKNNPQENEDSHRLPSESRGSQGVQLDYEGRRHLGGQERQCQTCAARGPYDDDYRRGFQCDPARREGRCEVRGKRAWRGQGLHRAWSHDRDERQDG